LALLALPTLAGTGQRAESIEEVCTISVTSVYRLRWASNITREAAIADFEHWLSSAGPDTWAADPWYEQMIRTMIDSAYAAESPKGWGDRAKAACLLGPGT
jgi:hypothetical protein